MGFRSSKWVYAAFGLVLAVGFVPGLASGQTGNATQVGGADFFGVGADPINGGCFPFDPGPGEDGGGQVRISDSIPFVPPPGFALNLMLCNLTFNNTPGVTPALPGSMEILGDVFLGGAGELVRDTPVVIPPVGNPNFGHSVCSGVPPFLAPGFALAPKPGGKANEVIFETDLVSNPPDNRPSLRLQVKSRGGKIEFASGLKIDRACINRGDPIFPPVGVGPVWPPLPGWPLRTSFRLTCPNFGGTPNVVDINYLKVAFWRTTGPSGGCLHNPVFPNGINIRTP